MTNASFHLEEEALQWFRWMDQAHGPLSWLEFSEGLITRFGLTEFEDHASALPKL